jgi:hypothetical protein
MAAAFAEGDALVDVAAAGAGVGVATFGEEAVGAATGPGDGVATVAEPFVAAGGASAAYHSFMP